MEEKQELPYGNVMSQMITLWFGTEFKEVLYCRQGAEQDCCRRWVTIHIYPVVLIQGQPIRKWMLSVNHHFSHVFEKQEQFRVQITGRRVPLLILTFLFIINIQWI